MRQEAIQPNSHHLDRITEAYEGLQVALRRSGTVEHIDSMDLAEALPIIQQLWVLSMEANIVINRYQDAQLPERRLQQ